MLSNRFFLRPLIKFNRTARAEILLQQRTKRIVTLHNLKMRFNANDHIKNAIRNEIKM